MLKKIKIQSIAVIAAVSVVLTSTASAASLKDASFETKTTDASVKIGNPVYSSNGESVNGDVYSGQNIDMTLPVALEEIRNITAITFLSDENNTICDITYDMKKSAIGSFELNNTLTVSKAHQNGKYTLKTFIWDGIDLSFIYADSFIYSNGKASVSANNNWNISGDASFSSEMALEGLSSLKIKSDAKAFQTAEIEANKVYKLDFAAVGEANIKYDVVNTKDGISLIGGAKYFEGSENWSFPSNVVFSADEKTQVNIVFEDADFGEASYIDCVKISEELLSNNSFDYELANFITDGTAEITDSSNSGEYAIFMNDGLIKQYVNLVGNRVYTLGAFLSGDDAYLKILDANENVIAFKKADAKSNYFEDTMDFYIEEDGKYTVEVRADGKTYVDDISLARPSGELVTNGDFSNGSELWRTRGGGGTIEIVEGINGSKALMLSGRGQYYHGVTHSVVDNVNDYGLGKYKVCGYAKYADSGLKDGTLTVGFTGQYQNKDKGTATKNYTKSVSGLSSQWTYFEVEFDITTFGTDENGIELEWCPDVSQSDGNLYFETGKDDTGSFCIADISMIALGEKAKYPSYGEYDGPGEPKEPTEEPVPDPKPEKVAIELLTNGDFDNGTTDGWLVRGDNDNKSTFATTVGGANGTAYGVSLSNRPVYYTGIYQSLKQVFNTYGKRVYILSGYVKFTDSSDVDKIKAVIQTTPKSGSIPAKMYNTVISSVSNEWKYFEVEINIDRFLHENAENDVDEITAKDSACCLYFETISGNLRDFAIDNISLKTYIDVE